MVVELHLVHDSPRGHHQGKFALYRDVLKVKEYFLFDPFEDYLPRPADAGLPPPQGGVCAAIKPVAGRLAEPDSPPAPGALVRSDLRLWNPATGERLLTPQEARDQAEEATQRAEEQADLAEAEVEPPAFLEIDELRRRNGR